MRKFFVQFMIFLLVIAFVFGYMTYRTVHWNRPELPRTELTGLTLQTYLYSARQLPTARPDSPVGLSFSPEETSYLLENLDLNLNYRGFTVIDLHLDNAGEDVLVEMVLEGPLGLYYRANFRGVINYTAEQGAWRIIVNDLSLGAFPLEYLVFGPFRPGWPDSLLSGAVSIRELRLDGKGLRATVDRFKLDLKQVLGM